jgi:hypothetical protein
MSDLKNEPLDTSEEAVLRLHALLKVEHDRTATLQAEVQALKVNQVEIVRFTITPLSSLLDAMEIPNSFPCPF